MTFISQSPVQAQDINKFVSIAKPAEWVEKHSAPSGEFVLGKDEEFQYLLFDRQVKLSATDKKRYSHYVDQFWSPKAVEDHATVKFSFDPAYQTIQFHHMHLIRGDEIRDILDLSAFEIYRYETDRDKLIYNGALEIAYLIPDVRVGDKLDYALTISGKNPAVGEHVFSSMQHEFGVPVQRLFQRVIAPADVALQTRTFQNAPEPNETKIGEFSAYTWDRQDVKGRDTEKDSPKWYYAMAHTQFSSMESWQEVGKHFAENYEPPKTLIAPLEAVVDDIRLKSDDPKVLVREALDFVQREVRYLGIELGAGGYIPRPPNLVFNRRFGDCKDMTLLLITMLDRLGVKAVPLLVHSDFNDNISQQVPSLAAFDHVIVKAEVGGKSYLLDPTRGQQLGDLDRLQQGEFGKGVVIAHDSPGMIDADAAGPEFWKEVVDTYDLVSDPEVVTMTSVTSYFMGEADHMMYWHESGGLENSEKSFLEFYQHNYPSIEQTSPMKVEKFTAEGKISFSATYKIPNAWDKREGENVLYVLACDIRYDIPDFVAGERQIPYAFNHPVATKQVVKLLLDDTWDMPNSSVKKTRDAFEFRANETFVDDVYTSVYTYKSKADFIAADDFQETMKVLEDVDDLVWSRLSVPNGALSFLSDLSEDDFELIGLGLCVLLLFAALIGMYRCRDFDREWRDDSVFHPVALRKFIPLSIMTFSLYSVYWIYRNWRWMKFVQGKNIWPFWRSAFSMFTNFSLFTAMSEVEPQGFRWFKRAVIPLGIAYLVLSVIANMTEAFSTVYLAPLVLIPVVLHVNKMNAGRADIIAKYSKYDLPVWGLIALVAPLFALAVWGSV